MNLLNIIREFNENESRENREIEKYLQGLRKVKEVQFKEKILGETKKGSTITIEEVRSVNPITVDLESRVSIGKSSVVIVGKVREIMNILGSITEEEFENMKRKVAA